MDSAKDLTLASGSEMANGLFLTEIEAKLLTEVQVYKLMDIIHFIFKDKLKDCSMSIISEHQVQWTS